MLAFISACISLNPTAIVQAGGYIGLFVIIFSESGLLFGILFPGDSLLFAAGLLAGGSILGIVPTLFSVILGAILGDNVGYWFGKNVGQNLFSRPNSRVFKQEYVARTQKFYATYGPRAVVLARFVPVVRTLAPILAGVVRMPYKKFISYNALGGFGWGAGMVLLGYFLGKALPASEHYVLPISLVIVVVSFLPILFNVLRGKRAI